MEIVGKASEPGEEVYILEGAYYAEREVPLRRKGCLERAVYPAGTEGSNPPRVNQSRSDFPKADP